MSTLKKVISQPRFVACAVLLAASAVGMRSAAHATSRWIEKRPVPIRKRLAIFDRGALSGFRFVEDIGEGSAKDVETEEYLEWRFLPTSAAATTDVAYLNVYYYTAGEDQKTLLIPHTPEVCYRQSGNQTTGLGAVEIPVTKLPGVESIGARYVRMSHPTVAENRDFCVVYLFCVNGKFYDDREKARIHLALPWERAVYFSKIECVTKIPAADRLSEALETCKQMLSDAIPELVQRHFPRASDIEGALQ